jgi:CHAT domain-containing protein/predicted negative regulator of RcsB-dependent stress response
MYKRVGTRDSLVSSAISVMLLMFIYASTTIAQLSKQPVGSQSTLKRSSALAEKATDEGDRLRAEWKRESLQMAATKYIEAQSLWHTINDFRREADLLKRLGEIHSILSNYRIAINYYDRALQLAGNSLDKQFEIDVLYQMGNAYLEMADVNNALPYCHHIQEISRQIGYQKGSAKGLNCLGVASSISSDVLTARESFDQAMIVWQPKKADDVVADTLLNLGYLHSNLGNAELSLQSYKRAFEIWQASSNQQKQALTLTAMAGVYFVQGEKQKALNLHNQALKLFQAIGNRNGEAAALNGIGYFYDDLGEKEQALRHYQQALLLFQSIDNPHYAAVTLGYIGRVYFALGRKDEALEFYTQKLATSRSVKDRRMEAYALRDIGNVVATNNEVAKALSYYKQALALSEQVLDRRGSAYLLNSIGGLQEQLSHRSEALSYYEQALTLMQAVADRRGEVLTLYNLARTQRDLGLLNESRLQIERSINLIENLRTKVTSPALRISYLETVYQHYEFYVDLLMQLHRRNPGADYEILALEANEHARARTLLENLIAAGTDIREGVDSQLLAEEGQIRQRLSQKAEQLTRLLSGRFSSQQAASLNDEVEVLLAQLREIESRVRDESPKYAALTQPPRLKLSDMQAELDKDTLLLEYYLGAERSYCWVVTSTSITSQELPRRSDIEEAAEKLYAQISTSSTRRKGESQAQQRDRVARNTNAYPAAAAKLSALLLEPIASLLGQKRLVIVADGILQYIPFIALPEPGQERLEVNLRHPLILSHEVIMLPSLSTLAILRKEVRGRTPAAKAVAVLADPVFKTDDPRVRFARQRSSIPLPRRGVQNDDAGLKDEQLERAALELSGDDEPIAFERLPFSFEEAQAISAIVPKLESKQALGFNASLRTALDPELRKFRIIHFATHALLNNSYPELSGIVLSLVDPAGRPQNGFLRLNDIYNLKLPAELVVLSACQTALGKEARGEGLIGLTRGFMYAGVARIVATLWRINDRSSAELMRYFYEAMFRQHLAPAAALRAAQIRMWQTNEWRFPHYWAAFLLQGEWN